MPTLQDNTERKALLTLLQSGQNPQHLLQKVYQWCQSHPDDVPMWMAQGALCGQLGDYAGAETCYSSAAKLQPDAAQAHCFLGLARFFQGKMSEALIDLQQAVTLQPLLAEGHMHLGCLLRDIGNYEDAICSFTSALELKPDLVDTRVYLGDVYRHMGKLDEAIACYDTVLENYPGHPGASAGKAIVFEQCGEIDAAWSLLDPLIAAQAPRPEFAYILAVLAPRLGNGDQAIDYIQTLIQQVNLTPSEHAQLHFAAARLLDKLKRYDEVMPHLNAANSLMPHTFNTRAYQQFMQRTKDSFSSLPASIAASDNSDGPIPIFIIGMPRSGTTLVEQILASHPRVQPMGEMRHLGDIVRNAHKLLNRSCPYPELLASLDVDTITRLRTEYLGRIPPLQSGITHFTDKMPKNYEYAGLIPLLFPEARVIHCTRNPADTCLSCYFQNFGSRNSYVTDLQALGAVYQEYVQLMEFWKQRMNLHEIAYESVVNNLENSSRMLLAFCGLDWDQECLSFHKTRRQIQTASYAQVRQPIYRASINKWQHYSDDLSVLIEALGPYAPTASQV